MPDKHTRKPEGATIAARGEATMNVVLENGDLETNVHLTGGLPDDPTAEDWKAYYPDQWWVHYKPTSWTEL